MAGGYFVVTLPWQRRVAMDSYTAMPAGHKMIALLELDVTELARALDRARSDGARLSMFACVVAALARALVCFPMLNALHHRARVVCFDDVDVNIPVEVEGGAAGREVRQVVVRRAQEKSAAAIYAEIDGARHRASGAAGEAGTEDHFAHWLMRAGAFVPRFLRLFLLRRLIASTRMAKRFAGTTSITSLAKFVSVSGFAIPLTPSPMVSMFALGSVLEKPSVVDGQIAVRSLLSMTMVIDHDVVDGGDAARFLVRLQTELGRVASSL